MNHCALVLVSIHAPAWGATKQKIRLFEKNKSFNPRARMGRDKGFLAGGFKGITFQSTRPHGARRILQIRCKETVNVSIHAPAWGATKISPLKMPTRTSFNPRARMGRDLDLSGVSSPPSIVSIHAPAWGATLQSPPDVIKRYEFQSTRPHGARRGCGG